MFQPSTTSGVRIARLALIVALCVKTASAVSGPQPLKHPDEAAHGGAPSRPVPSLGDTHDHEGEPDAHDRSPSGTGQTANDSPGHGDHEAHGHAEGLRLSPAQRRTLAIRTAVLHPRPLGDTLNAPGEVQLNAYATAQVTPRIEAQVTSRHARLGDYVEAGQPLVTLSSVELAQAQGDLIVAEREWRRLERLKGEFVSDRSYLEARVARQTARSRVLAFGMTDTQADALVKDDSARADGTFVLLAPRAGTVVHDHFVLGELVEPGRVLFEITDEEVRWVEARMPPEETARVSVGDPTQIRYRAAWLEGQVSQIHHLLDEVTRTQSVRIEVPDPGHRLHPGVFVDVEISVEEGDPVLALPESAVLRGPDGHWQVFLARDDGTYAPREVELVRTDGGQAVIQGLPAGTEVVTEGAFFLQSELAKGGFDPHQH